MKKYIEKITVILFFCVLSLFLILNVLSKEVVFSENENRYLITLNKLFEEDLLGGGFDEKFESYLSDQFVYRDNFMSINTISKKAVGYFEVNHVYFGEDGYLLNKYDYTNTKYLKGNIKAVNEFASRNTVNLMLVPSSSYTLNKLPRHAYTTDEKQMIVEIYNELKTNNIDVYEELKNSEDNYYKLDHHWNEKGAFIAYKKIIENLLNEAPKEFDYKVVSEDFKGTTYSKAGAFWYKGENILEILSQAKITKVEYDKKPSDSIYNHEKLNTKDKYAFYVDGNHGLVTIESDCKNNKELVLFNDSYGHILIPYLINNYNKITMVDLRYYNESIDTLINDDCDILFVYSLDSFVSDTNLYKLK